MYVLTYAGAPIAASERRERLSEKQSDYPAAMQRSMSITKIEVLQ